MTTREDDVIRGLRGGSPASMYSAEELWDAFRQSNIDTFVLSARSDCWELVRMILASLVPKLTAEAVSYQLPSGERSWDGTIAHVAARLANKATYEKLSKKFPILLNVVKNSSGETPNELFQKRLGRNKEWSKEVAMKKARTLGIVIEVINGEPSIRISDVAKLKKALGL